MGACCACGYSAEDRRKYECIAQTALIVHFSEGQLRDLARLFTFEQFKPFDKIVRQGDPTEKLYIIADGEVTLQLEDKSSIRYSKPQRPTSGKRGGGASPRPKRPRRAKLGVAARGDSSRKVSVITITRGNSNNGTTVLTPADSSNPTRGSMSRDSTLTTGSSDKQGDLPMVPRPPTSPKAPSNTQSARVRGTGLKTAPPTSPRKDSATAAEEEDKNAGRARRRGSMLLDNTNRARTPSDPRPVDDNDDDDANHGLPPLPGQAVSSDERKKQTEKTKNSNTRSQKELGRHHSQGLKKLVPELKNPSRRSLRVRNKQPRPSIFQMCTSMRLSSQDFMDTRKGSLKSSSSSDGDVLVAPAPPGRPATTTTLHQSTSASSKPSGGGTTDKDSASDAALTASVVPATSPGPATSTPPTLLREPSNSHSRSRVSVNLAVKKKGAFFGHVGFLEEKSTMTHTVVCNDKPTLVMSIDKATLMSHIEAHPELDRPVRDALGNHTEKHLKKMPIFQNVDDANLRLLASVLHYKTLPMRSILFREGDIDEERGNPMYIVYSGEAQAVAVDDDDEIRILNTFKKGQFFGEIGLIIDVPRTATIVATSERCLLLELGKRDFQNFLRLSADSEQLERNITGLMKKRTAESFRKYKVPFFSAIPDSKYALLAKLCDIEQLSADEVIFREGTDGDKLYLILDGECSVRSAKIRKKETIDCELARLGPGNYFGETALFHKDKHLATVVALTRVVLVTISRANYSKFCQEVPEAMSDFELKSTKYHVTLRAVLHHSLGYRFFEDHLKREYATENLHFWVASRDFFIKYKREFPDESTRADVDGDLLDDDEDENAEDVFVFKSRDEQSVSDRKSMVLTFESMLEDAETIRDKWVLEDAKHPVNINGNTRTKCVQAIAEKKVTAAVFSAAQKEILRLMQTDSFPRFKQSELFQSFLEEWERQTKARRKTRGASTAGVANSHSNLSIDTISRSPADTDSIKPPVSPRRQRFEERVNYTQVVKHKQAILSGRIAPDDLTLDSTPP